MPNGERARFLLISQSQSSNTWRICSMDKRAILQCVEYGIWKVEAMAIIICQEFLSLALISSLLFSILLKVSAGN